MIDGVQHKVIAILAEQAFPEPAEVWPQATLADFGIDSMGHVEAIFAIESMGRVASDVEERLPALLRHA